jgi:hypothetical protein
VIRDRLSTGLRLLPAIASTADAVDYHREMLRVVAIALVLALMSTAVAVAIIGSRGPQVRASEWSGADDGERSWTVRRQRGPGFDWVHLELQLSRSTGAAFMNHVPEWARPPRVEHDMEVCFVGTLSTGWPLPWFVRRWEDPGGLKDFPTPLELETPTDPETGAEISGNHPALTMALGAKGLMLDRSVTRIRWAPALLSLLIWFAAWLVPVVLVRRVLARRA